VLLAKQVAPFHRRWSRLVAVDEEEDEYDYDEIEE